MLAFLLFTKDQPQPPTQKIKITFQRSGELLKIKGQLFFKISVSFFVKVGAILLKIKIKIFRQESFYQDW